MTTYPAYARYAFRAIRIIDSEEYENEEILAFIDRWGDITLSTFTRALREGVYEDQQVAIFALGSTESQWAKDLILPYLRHERPEVRWAAALTLGEMRVEAAYPTLAQMLQEFLPPHSFVEYDWYDVKHISVAHLLGSWGRHEAISELKATLQQIWLAEEQLIARQQDIQMETHYEDALVYALGQLGAFDALADLEVTPSRRRFWAIGLILGYLNIKHLAQTTIIDLLTQASRNKELAALLVPVPDLLQQKMGFSAHEAAIFSKIYQDEYFDRWETLKEQAR
jgi:hypothetical protein